MKKTAKDETFKKLLNESYGSSAELIKLINQINNVKETMSKYNDFKKLSAKSQFDICCTICIIATQTSREDLEKVKLSGRESKEVFDYSINRNYVPK